MLTPQVTVIENGGTPHVGSQSATAPLPTVSEVQTSEKDYLSEVSRYSEPSNADKAAALAAAVENGFEYERKVAKNNGSNHQSIADKIEAATELVSHN